MALVKLVLSNELPRETRDKLVESVYKVWFEMHGDEFGPATPIPIEVASVHADIIGALPCAHDGSQPSSHALALSGGEEPALPADNDIEEPDGYVGFSDVSVDLKWRECVAAAHRKHRFHYKTTARVIQGVPNHLFKEAQKLWELLPVQMVAKEDRKRIGIRKNLDRLRKQAKRFVQNQERQARRQALIHDLEDSESEQA